MDLGGLLDRDRDGDVQGPCDEGGCKLVQAPVGRRFPNSCVALLILEKTHFIVDHGAAQLNSKPIPSDHDMGQRSGRPLQDI